MSGKQKKRKTSKYLSQQVLICWNILNGGGRGVTGTEKPLEVSVKTEKMDETPNLKNIRNRKTASKFW